MTDLAITNEPKINSQKKVFTYIYFAAAVALILFGIEYYKANYAISSQAKNVITMLETIASDLEVAESTGDKAGALALLEPITKVLNDYNDTSEAGKATINNSDLRYCLLAATHLSTGISSVYESGNWNNKEQYESALNACN